MIFLELNVPLLSMDSHANGGGISTKRADIVKRANYSKCGFDLQYIPTSTQSPIILTNEDVKDGREKWKCGLVGVVLGSNPSYFVMKKFVEDKWKEFGHVTITKLKSGTFTFLFDNEDAKLKVMEKGPWMFYSKILILKPWSPTLDATTDMVNTLPIWIRLMNPKFDYFTPLVLSKLASHIGIPLFVDQATANQSRLDFARICVEVNAKSSFPNSIPFVNAMGIQESIEVVYEWRPPNCSHCHSFGHSTPKCPSMVQTAKVWKPRKPLEDSTKESSHAKEARIQKLGLDTPLIPQDKDSSHKETSSFMHNGASSSHATIEVELVGHNGFLVLHEDEGGIDDSLIGDASTLQVVDLDITSNEAPNPMANLESKEDHEGSSKDITLEPEAKEFCLQPLEDMPKDLGLEVKDNMETNLLPFSLEPGTKDNEESLKIPKDKLPDVMNNKRMILMQPSSKELPSKDKSRASIRPKRGKLNKSPSSKSFK